MKYTGSFTQNNQIQFPMTIIPGTQCYPCQKGQRLNQHKTAQHQSMHSLSRKSTHYHEKCQQIFNIIQLLDQLFNIIDQIFNTTFVSTKWSQHLVQFRMTRRGKMRCSLQNLKTKFSIFFWIAQIHHWQCNQETFHCG